MVSNSMLYVWFWSVLLSHNICCLYCVVFTFWNAGVCLYISGFFTPKTVFWLPNFSFHMFQGLSSFSSYFCSQGVQWPSSRMLEGKQFYPECITISHLASRKSNIMHFDIIVQNHCLSVCTVLLRVLWCNGRLAYKKRMHFRMYLLSSGRDGNWSFYLTAALHKVHFLIYIKCKYFACLPEDLQFTRYMFTIRLQEGKVPYAIIILHHDAFWWASCSHV